MDYISASSRRQFLKLSGLAGAASILPACSTLANTEVKPAGQAKNVIYLMVDGLCNGTVGLAHHWHLRHKATPLNWMQLFGESIQYKIIYNGTPNIFLNDMRKKNLELEMKNNMWTLK